MKRRDYFNIFILCVLIVVLIILCVPADSIFGSRTDWINQHSVIPQYIRELVYQQHTLIPDFASALGSGQNIFNFSYYGLFRPDILVSYFLPQVAMVDIIIFGQIISLFLDGGLIYYWLKSHTKNSNTCLISSIFFITAAPLIFHSHRQIMFVDYMPWLILGFIAIDRFFQKNKKGLLIVSCTLIILTSYYFAIACLGILLMYAIYRSYQQIEIMTLRVKNIAIILLCMILSVCLCAFMLLPTAWAMLEGRGNANPISFIQLFIPRLSMNSLLYDPYSAGMSIIAVIALTWRCFQKQIEKKVSAIFIYICLLFPLIWFILNGFLYARSKILIPLLPIMALIIADFIESLRNAKIKKTWILATFIIFIIIYLKTDDTIRYMLVLDIICTVLLILSTRHFTKDVIAIGLSILIGSTMCLSNNKQETYIKKSEISELGNKDKIQLIQSALTNSDYGFRFDDFTKNLSTSNMVYDVNQWKNSQYSSINNRVLNEFYYDIVKNPMSARNRVATVSSSQFIFQELMGVRYVITKQKPPAQYTRIAKKGRYILAENKNAFPLIYASSNLMDEESFQGFSWEEKLQALSQSAIVEHRDKNNYISLSNNLQEFNMQDLSLVKQSKYLKIDATKEGYQINAKKDSKMILSFDQPLNGDALLIHFKVKPKNRRKDLSILINGIQNKLSSTSSIYANKNNEFHYILSSSEELKKLTVQFSKGNYEIDNIHITRLSNQILNTYREQIDEFHFDEPCSSLADIKGNIDISKDGYLVTSIPYQKGFNIKLNGKTTPYEKVNHAFIGIPIKKGHYDIQITFETPWLKEGLWISSISLLIFIGIMLKQKKERNLVI